MCVCVWWLEGCFKGTCCFSPLRPPVDAKGEVGDGHSALGIFFYFESLSISLHGMDNNWSGDGPSRRSTPAEDTLPRTVVTWRCSGCGTAANGAMEMGKFWPKDSSGFGGWVRCQDVTDWELGVGWCPRVFSTTEDGFPTPSKCYLRCPIEAA